MTGTGAVGSGAAVTWPRRATIFWRTFLLSLTALVIAEGVGLVLSGAQPTSDGPPVNLGDLARWLLGSQGSVLGGATGNAGVGGKVGGADTATVTGGSASAGGAAGVVGPPVNSGPPEVGGLVGPPDALGPPGGLGAPGTLGGPGTLEGPGAPGTLGRPGTLGGPLGPPPDLVLGGVDELPAVRRRWVLSDEERAPEAPGDVDDGASSRLTGLLATRLGVEQARVRLYVSKVGVFDEGGAPVEADELRLRKGFIAGFERSGGQWRVLENRSAGIADLFQRRVVWELALGVAVLLPVSWMFARALSAPIRRFSEAAKRLGTDPYAPALERDGPAEMLVAIDSFNAMQGRVTRLLQERSQMVAAIAHDLRTPLTRLTFRLDGLESPLKERVESDIQQMTLMIAATLDFVRDRSLGGTRERLDLRLLVESVVDDQSDVGHDVRIDGVETVPLRGDPVALRRAFANLVDNAVTYGERARVHLRVSDGNCVVDIDDDGPGIPEGLQERVFEPFFRAERSRNRDTGGIGLGLTTVRSIVVDHGGAVTLRNRKNGGLRVGVTLPVG